MCWRTETTLGDLDPDAPIEITARGRLPIQTTARELINQARLPAFLTVEQVEFAFSGPH